VVLQFIDEAETVLNEEHNETEYHGLVYIFCKSICISYELNFLEVWDKLVNKFNTFVTYCAVVDVFGSESEVAPIALVFSSPQFVDVVVVPRGHNRQF
jgi:hypothetical protein